MMGILFIVALIIIWLIVYIKTLIRMAKRKEWAWFVFGLLISVTVLIYWIVRWKLIKKMLEKW